MIFSSSSRPDHQLRLLQLNKQAEERWGRVRKQISLCSDTVEGIKSQVASEHRSRSTLLLIRDNSLSITGRIRKSRPSINLDL